MGEQDVKGLGVFGTAYRAMYERDPHAPGSVDRVLQSRMVRLSADTIGQFYEKPPQPPRPMHPGTRSRLAEVVSGCGDIDVVDAIIEHCADVVSRAPDSLDDLVFGGTEEEIAERGSEWCTDVSRVACAMAQIGGLPARIAVLADIGRAYSGHAIVEVFVGKRWLAVDAVNSVRYGGGGSTSVSVRRLVSEPTLALSFEGVSDEMASCFAAAALTEYPLSMSAEFDYATSRLDAYNRSILVEADRGWPGGPRWLHGETARLGK